MAEDPNATSMMLNVLKRRISVWEKILATPSVPAQNKQKIADEVMWMYTAMNELSAAGPPRDDPSNDPATPSMTKNITARTSSELTAEDQAEFEAIAKRRSARAASNAR